MDIGTRVGEPRRSSSAPGGDQRRVVPWERELRVTAVAVLAILLLGCLTAAGHVPVGLRQRGLRRADRAQLLHLQRAERDPPEDRRQAARRRRTASTRSRSSTCRTRRTSSASSSSAGSAPRTTRSTSSAWTSSGPASSRTPAGSSNGPARREGSHEGRLPERRRDGPLRGQALGGADLDEHPAALVPQGPGDEAAEDLGRDARPGREDRQRRPDPGPGGPLRGPRRLAQRDGRVGRHEHRPARRRPGGAI